MATLTKNKILDMENRAWHGTRCVTEAKEVRKGHKIIWEIDYHHVLQVYVVEEYHEVIKDNKRDTYGKGVFNAKTPEECVEWIENNYNVKINPTDPLIKKAY
jgi:hypothetical protein